MITLCTFNNMTLLKNGQHFVLRMGRKAVGPVCYVMHIQEPRTLIVKEKGGLPPCFWIHPDIAACTVGCVNK